MSCPECMSLRTGPRLLDDGGLPKEYECVRCGHVYEQRICPGSPNGTKWRCTSWRCEPEGRCVFPPPHTGTNHPLPAQSR